MLGESALEFDGQTDEGMAQFIGREPTPESAVQFAEDVERLLDDLGNATLEDHRPAQAGGPQLDGDRQPSSASRRGALTASWN